MHFNYSRKEDLIRLINSKEFETVELGKSISETLIRKCNEFNLKKEAEIVRSRTVENTIQKKETNKSQ